MVSDAMPTPAMSLRRIRRPERFTTPQQAAESLRAVADKIAQHPDWVTWEINVSYAGEEEVRHSLELDAKKEGTTMSAPTSKPLCGAVGPEGHFQRCDLRSGHEGCHRSTSCGNPDCDYCGRLDSHCGAEWPQEREGNQATSASVATVSDTAPTPERIAELLAQLDRSCLVAELLPGVTAPVDERVVSEWCSLRAGELRALLTTAQRLHRASLSSPHDAEIYAVALGHAQSYAREGSTFPMIRRREVARLLDRLALLEAERCVESPAESPQEDDEPDIVTAANVGPGWAVT